MNTLQKHLIFFVRSGMAQQHWTMTKLADQAGCSASQISRMLSGKSPGTLEIWSTLLELLKVPGFH